jgi:hypothetical protein
MDGPSETCRQHARTPEKLNDEARNADFQSAVSQNFILPASESNGRLKL